METTDLAPADWALTPGIPCGLEPHQESGVEDEEEEEGRRRRAKKRVAFLYAGCDRRLCTPLGYSGVWTTRGESLWLPPCHGPGSQSPLQLRA